jgi:hypothetical protein
MKRVRGQNSAIVRRWIGLVLAILLAFSPALNLIIVPSASAAPGHHHLSQNDDSREHHQPDGCPGVDHLDLKCLQCLAMGGMSLAGAEVLAAPVPNGQSIDTARPFARRRLEPVSVHIPISRGPPAFA